MMNWLLMVRHRPAYGFGSAWAIRVMNREKADRRSRGLPGAVVAGEEAAVALEPLIERLPRFGSGLHRLLI